MALPNPTLADVQVNGNEYPTDQVLNRCISRLLANDLELYDITESLSGDISDLGGDVSAIETTPTGTILPLYTEIVPTGYLECNGSAISRTTYASLFSAIGTVAGVGDSSTTFNIPDLRGEFLRGWDNGAGIDPDAATRTDSGDGTVGDGVGTKQDFATAPQAIPTTSVKWYSQDPASWYDRPIDGGVDTDQLTTIGDNETRPRNINVMYCIKY